MFSKKLKLGVFVALAALAPALMGPSGGYPSNPTFQNVTVVNTATGGTFNGTHNGTFSGTTVSGTTGTFSGAISASGFTGPLSGSVTGGSISGTTGTFTGAISASGFTGPLSGSVTGGSISGTTGTFTGAISGTTGSFNGTLTATGISGTSNDAVFHSLSIGDNVGFAAGPNILSTTNLQIGSSGAGGVVFWTNNISRTSLSSSGDWTVSSPTSGNPFTINNVSDNQLHLNATSGQYTTLSLDNASTAKSQIYWDNSNLVARWTSSASIELWLNNAQKWIFPTSGGMYSAGLSDKGAGTVNVAGLYVNGNTVGLGTQYVVSASNETRNTTTCTNSSNLTLSIANSGTYQIDAVLITYSSTSTAGQGYRFSVNYSGTYTAASSVSIGMGSSTTPNQPFPIQSSAVCSNYQDTTEAVSTTPKIVHFKGTLVATGAGTLAIGFSENTGDVVNLATLGTGSYLSAARML